MGRGSNGVYVAIMDSSWLLRGIHPALFRESRLRGSYGTDLGEGETVVLILVSCDILFTK